MAAYPDPPGSPHEINNGLIDIVHRSIRHHPSVDAKSIYGGFLAKLLALQAKQHAAHQTAGQHGLSGGAQIDSADPGTGAQPGQVVASLTGSPLGGPSFYGSEPPPSPLAALIAATNAQGPMGQPAFPMVRHVPPGWQL